MDFELRPILETHDLKLVCRHCCVKEREITYTLKSVNHDCAYEILLCRVKEGRKWRPVFRLPTHKNTGQYMVCSFFTEGSGCTKDGDRCTFARSEEEAAVWNFQKTCRLESDLLRNLLAISGEGSDELDNEEALDQLKKVVDLKVVCDLCSTRTEEITYTMQPVKHQCGRSLLLAKVKASDKWRPVSRRTITRNILYKVCIFFDEGSGCSQHGQGCTYARSCEEATVWNFIQMRKINENQLMELINDSGSVSSSRREAQDIIQKFKGKFIELCQECFNNKSHIHSEKRWNDTCTSDEAHSWRPVLVHQSVIKQEEVFSQVRPLPPNCEFTCCSHVRKKRPCWQEPGHCHDAQSEVELAIWEAEHKGFDVQRFLLQLSEQETRTESMFCKVCRLYLNSPESFYEHCQSTEHTQLLSADTTTEWRGRPPPHGLLPELWLCNRPEDCEDGTKCTKAHSKEELQEWMMRAAPDSSSGEGSVGQSYNKRLLEEYRNSKNEAYIMSEHVDDVSIVCDKDLTVKCANGDTELTWKFQVETMRTVMHVALLKQEPGASFSISDAKGQPCIYSPGSCFLKPDNTYDISVFFKSSNPGLYEQWLVLDFDTRPVLLRKIRVTVSQHSLEKSEELTKQQGAAVLVSERWHRRNRVIIPCLIRNAVQEELLNEYDVAQISSLRRLTNSRTPLNEKNYKERMHQFLYDEEQAEDQIVSGLNLEGEISTMKCLSTPQGGMMFALEHELFGVISMPCNLTLDSPEGLLLKQSVLSALVSPLTSVHSNSTVYEASIMQQRSSKNQLNLQLSRQCCVDLKLRENGKYQMEVQFQLDRLKFCNMHKAVDLLQDTRNVLPDLQNCIVPVSNREWTDLNARQHSAVAFITGKSNDKDFVAPLLIFGPFGTGKTHTLAAAARELCRRQVNKVLICTHTNSSADLYVREHLHRFIKENEKLKPIRIKTNKQGLARAATDEVTLKYCSFFEDEETLPSKIIKDLHHHNIVITTTTVASYFTDPELLNGYFTHILIDEASQMLESEALMAINLAGPNTRVVLAGDHMQIVPKLFSVNNQQSSNSSLLTRLFHLYQGHECDAAQGSRMIFNKNYRSTKEIVDFVSSNFYAVKNDAIKEGGSVPPPSNGRALTFHHVRGECVLDEESLTWYNMEEAAIVVNTVKEIMKDWPTSWGPEDAGSICVLSEGLQVRVIRAKLSREHLPEVCVENLANVQGKQFRAVIMTVVQTRDSLKTINLQGLDLFNDARVLNTAMTRAQSLVVVVGDATALSCSGKCSRIWKNYIHHCFCRHSMKPQSFTQDFFNRDVKETMKFQRVDLVEESNSLDDEILKELENEYEQMRANYDSDQTSLDFDDLKDEFLKEHPEFDDPDDALLQFCKKHPDQFIQGKLVRTSHLRGYVEPHDSINQQIPIKGRRNLGKSFTGDEVVIQVSPTPTVISVTKESESARVLLCTIDEKDHTIPRVASTRKNISLTMVPLAKTETKICILLNKKTQKQLPIWEKNDGWWQLVEHLDLDVNLKRNNVFIVQVIGWKNTCLFPLGNVIGRIQVTGSLSNEIRILREELKINSKATDSTSSLVDKNEVRRHDMRDVITFTVDPVGAKDLDDAISVQCIGDRHKIGIHIADVASFVVPGSHLDTVTRQRGCTYYSKGDDHIHMFPQNLSTGLFSLLQGEDRSVVSLIFTVENRTSKIIGTPDLQLSLIKSDRQLSYAEAETIITQRKKDNVRFETVEDCVMVAHSFAKAQRQARLKDWQYSQADTERLPGSREAHLMIENLSVLFNQHVSAILTASEKTSFCTPLCCQEKPNPEKLEGFEGKHGAAIPLSFHLRHRAQENAQGPTFDNFSLLWSVWEEICSAVKRKNTDQMIDLIAADDMHPLLQPAINDFKGCNSKMNILCSNSPGSDIGHYSLSLESYTKASSPIRRYMDIFVQRLTLCAIGAEKVQYSQNEMMAMCREFMENHSKAKKYQKRADRSFYSVSMKKHCASKKAFVVQADSKGDRCAVSFPLDTKLFDTSLSIMYRDLQVEEQPVYNESNHSITLRWNRWIFAADKKMPLFRKCRQNLQLPLPSWRKIIAAIDKEDWPRVLSYITQLGKSLPTNNQRASQQTPVKSESGSLVNIDLSVQRGDILQVQITSELKRGFHVPTLQLVQIREDFEICVDHVHDPVKCFSRCAEIPSKLNYHDAQEYVMIWEPLCEMESAVRAVGENNSIIIENLMIKFKQVQKGRLTGIIIIPNDWMEEWANKQIFEKSFLCIRKRGLEMISTVLRSPLVDPSEFTWIAHGVPSCLEQRHQDSEFTFNINHQPMETIPKCVWNKNTKFTVEIIPKLLPDIREENAVVAVQSACELVQAIVLGRNIPSDVKPSLPDGVIKQPSGLTPLNATQNWAVRAALKNPFTLIQGPPGTGKTVVGAHIVWQFLKQNSDSTTGGNKRNVILYCGPSNKSVDVVAEQLLKLEGSVKLLRVYSHQVEMLEYPYTDNALQWSRNKVRQDCSKPELRRITLHHLIRSKGRIYSAEILAFDQLFQEAQEKKKKLPSQTIRKYKDLLKKAREFEFNCHDVILCTCTESSNPTLHRTVNARQIIIDECAMATEPQTLIPLTCNKPEKVVLIGDHKQLQPIVTCDYAKKLGMTRSLFERCYTVHTRNQVMLDIQYRMQKDICQFPSDQFYDGKLKTQVEPPNSVLRVNKKTMPFVFGHVKGTTVSLVVSSVQGNERSKANEEERKVVISIAEKLVKAAKIPPQGIVILCPYNAQVSKIKEELRGELMKQITVTTISKSQGSEWRYVLLSTVCSLPSEDIEPSPERGWIRKHLGFTEDPHLINVAITRAKEGLCIIGDQELLQCNRTWKSLLKHYRRHNAVTDAHKISVKS